MPNNLGSIIPPSSLSGGARSFPPPLNLRGSDGGGPLRALQPASGSIFFSISLVGIAHPQHEQWPGRGYIRRNDGHRRCDQEAALAAADAESVNSGCQGKLSRKKAWNRPSRATPGSGNLGSVCFATVLSDGGTHALSCWVGRGQRRGRRISPLGPCWIGRARGGRESVG